jgi:hypothetical protein
VAGLGIEDQSSCATYSATGATSPRPCIRGLAELDDERGADATITLPVFPKISFAEAFRLNPVQNKRIHLRSENFLKVIRETRAVRCVTMQEAMQAFGGFAARRGENGKKTCGPGSSRRGILSFRENWVFLSGHHPG